MTLSRFLVVSITVTLATALANSPVFILAASSAAGAATPLAVSRSANAGVLSLGRSIRL